MEHDEANGISPQPWLEWSEVKQDFLVDFMFRLMPAWHRDWNTLVNKAMKTRVRIPKKEIDATLKISDYAFLLTLVEHHLESWKTDFVDNPDLRLKGQRDGVSKLENRMPAYEDWGNRVEEWKSNTLWDAWILKAQCKFLGITEGGQSLEGMPPIPPGKETRNTNKNRKVKLWKN